MLRLLQIYLLVALTEPAMMDGWMMTDLAFYAHVLTQIMSFFLHLWMMTSSHSQVETGSRRKRDTSKVVVKRRSSHRPKRFGMRAALNVDSVASCLLQAKTGM